MGFFLILKKAKWIAPDLTLLIDNHGTQDDVGGKEMEKGRKQKEGENCQWWGLLTKARERPLVADSESFGANTPRNKSTPQLWRNSPCFPSQWNRNVSNRHFTLLFSECKSFGEPGHRHIIMWQHSSSTPENPLPCQVPRNSTPTGNSNTAVSVLSSSRSTGNFQKQSLILTLKPTDTYPNAQIRVWTHTLV